MAKYKCYVCQATFEVEDGQTPICPVCGASGSDVEKIK